MSGALCLICKWQTRSSSNTAGDRFHYDCPRCGSYEVSRTLGQEIASSTKLRNKQQRALVSHALRLMQRGAGEAIKLNGDLLDIIIRNEKLPMPAQQADSLVQWLGDNQPSHSGYIDVPIPEIGAIIGTSDIGDNSPSGGLKFVLESLIDAKLVERQNVAGPVRARLTFPGWQRVEELRHQTTNSRLAFMAMSFKRPAVRTAYTDCFQPAVAATGFELRTVNDPSEAGLIDLRIEVGIRRAKFVVADLTDGNNGAYWEAGFGHGLGKKVFYTCEKGFFKRRKPHFDTSHHHIVVWDQDNLAAAIEELKTVIRATLPKDAKQED